MIYKTIEPDKKIALVVKSILVFEDDTSGETVLPFFADGYPGIMYQQTQEGLLVQPHNKRMPLLFIYGQTIQPIELVLKGNYRLVVFQLYPFVLKSFYNLNAEELNDSCYNISESKEGDTIVEALINTNNVEKQIEIISAYLYKLFQEKKSQLDFTVRNALQIILDNKGQVLIKDIYEKLHLTERTFERRFIKVAGIYAKQFCH